jgi:hypothetical protein
MKRLQIGLLAVGLLLVSAVAEAQERGGRGRGGFGFGGGGSLLSIVSNDGVQTELKLDDAKKAEVSKVAEELREQFRGGGRGQGGGGGQGRGEFQARMQEQAKQAEEKLKTVLNEEQFKRLKQIQYQVVGVLGAAQNADLAAALSLDDATKSKLAALSDEQREAMRDLREAVEDGSVQRDAMATEAEKVRKELEEKALALLSSEQKAKFTELVGAPYDVSALRSRGGFGGGGRGRRGA